MKVLLFSQYFWPESFRINEVAESLLKIGCEVTVLTGQPNYPQGKSLRDTEPSTRDITYIQADTQFIGCPCFLEAMAQERNSYSIICLLS